MAVDVVGHIDRKDPNMMEVVVMDDGEWTFHAAEYDTRPPFIFRVTRHAHSASSYAVREGIIKFKFVREATVEEIAHWLAQNPHHKIEGKRNVAIPK